MNLTEHEAKFAQAGAREALGNARATIERALVELDSYIDRYEEAESLTGKADVMNWTLNHLSTYMANNLRLDTLARAQAALVRADALSRSQA
jgi:hypothetical protein